MTAREFLVQEAPKFGFKIGEGFYGDVELYPTEGAATGRKLDELWTMLDRFGFEVSVGAGRKLMIRAPHVKRHEWDRNRGLDCILGWSLEECTDFVWA